MHPLRFCIAPEVFERWPEYRRYTLVGKGLDNAGDDPALLALLREAELEVRNDPDLEDYKEYPSIASWRSVFRDMGLNPNKFPPSIANLIRRTRSGKDLPFINRIVAIMNIISLKYRTPCGGDDLEGLKGDLRLGPAKGDEVFTHLGNPEAVENPDPGEIILHDTGNGRVFCRGWCWKNGDPSKITTVTNHVALHLDSLPPLGGATHKKAMEEMVGLLENHCGGGVEAWLIEPGNPCCEV
jgi:lysyl-tRNA synthetase class 2